MPALRSLSLTSAADDKVLRVIAEEEPFRLDALKLRDQSGLYGRTLRLGVPHGFAIVTLFPSMRRYQIELESVALTPEALAAADCVLVVTDHAAVDYELVGQHASLVVDTRNATAAVAEGREKIFKA